MNRSATTNVVPLAALSARFRANLGALAAREPALADRLLNYCPEVSYSIIADGDSVRLAVEEPAGMQLLANPVPPAAARRIVQQLTANEQLAGPLLVAGLDHGWLWDALAKLEITTPAAPGHRTPIYFLANDFERLWAVLHMHDWRAMLADRRCIFLADTDATAQLEQHLVANPQIAWPRTAVTVDPRAWPAGSSLDSLLATTDAEIQRRVAVVLDRLRAKEAVAPSTQSLAQVFANGRPLRVLGITSLYTTFLQHSMRDWLAGMQSLGHTTRLLIEQHDHEKPHPLVYLSAIDEFEPDLIVMIDHYRAELPLLPSHIPCVMWVQDRLPNIFTDKAGAAQLPLDFVIGHGRGECVAVHRYPPGRFLETPVGVNEERFIARPQPAKREFSCDVAFVSHASASPQQLIAEQISKQGNSPEAKRLFHDLHDRLAAIYDTGAAITADHALRTLVQQTLQSTKLDIENPQPLMDFVVQRLNNAFFRHQSLAWVVESGASLALYGRGWEQHPRFAPFARGIADNQTQLCNIYQSARVNLQVTPFGAAHQRTFEGLCAGAFFLFRQTDGDGCERIYRALWQWCASWGIDSDHAMRRHADEQVQEWLVELSRLRGGDSALIPDGFTDMLRSLARSGFTRAASTLFDEFDDVAFSTRDQLHQLLSRYLSDDAARTAFAAAMRARVVETMTYTGISRRMIDFIAEELAAAGGTERHERAA